ncbi:MAG: EAL domain-containing protein [Oscillatoria sp. SIO1A7]|nr:EAL domain-containing protein [Oscillatoria sp. SIO1A7]
MNANQSEAKRKSVRKYAAVSETEASLQAVLENTSDGIFMVDVLPVDLGADPVDFRLVAANSAYMRIMSLNTKNVSGLRIQDSLPEGWARATNLSLGCCAKQGESISYEATFELGGQSRTLLTTLSPVWRNDGTISQIVGVCQDVTERRRVLKEARLLQTLTLAIAESQNFHAALGVALRKICEVAGWDYGEGWVPDPTRDRLERSPAWYGASKYRQFRRLSEELTFPLETGVFGQVWSLHSTEWAPDVSPGDKSLLRVEEAIARGFKAGLSMPLLAGGEVLAVLVFFMAAPSGADRRLIEVISAITVQLGVVMHHKKYRHLFENALTGMFQTSPEGRYLTVNPMLARIYGYDSPEEMMAMLTDIDRDLYVDIKSRADFQNLVRERDSVCGFETRVYRKDGSIIWISERARAVRDPNGRIVGYEGTVEDITQRKQAELDLYQRDRLLQGTAEAMQHLLTNNNHSEAIEKALAILGQTTEVDRICLYENHLHPQIGELALSLRSEWVSTLVEPKLSKPHWQNLTYQSFGASRWYELLSAGNSIRGLTRESPTVERQLLEKEGIVSFLIVPILVSDQFWGCVGFEDCQGDRQWSESEISILLAIAASIGGAIQQQKTEEMIQYRASHDLLTGLPNRLLFDEHLEVALARAKRSTEMLAVCFVDLDRFKIVNDTLGHRVGDQLLQRASERLKGCLSKGDILARWGGDEFILLLPQISSAEDAGMVAKRLLLALQSNFDIEGHEISITASVGIAIYPTDGTTAETLMKNADTALYRAKDAGRNNYQIHYRNPHSPTASQELLLGNNLYLALEREEFVLYYQPIVRIDTGEIVQIESLVRWQHPELGLLLPQQFLPYAEENGSIIPIGRWVLQTACRQNKAWQDAGYTFAVTANISKRELQQPDLVSWIARILNETGLEPRLLELEITEKTAMEDVNFTQAILSEFDRMGVAIAIDDFGTAYGSLNSLQKFPIHTLKLPKTMVQSLTPHSYESATIAALVAFGKQRHLRVVAKGVETEARQGLLRGLHCQQMQGNLFSPPLSPADVTYLLENTAFKQEARIA